MAERILTRRKQGKTRDLVLAGLWDALEQAKADKDAKTQTTILVHIARIEDVYYE